MTLSNLIIPCVLLAAVLTVMFTEIIKKADKQKKLKGFYIYIPACMSVVLALALGFGRFIMLEQIPFYWAVIFALSTFGYEAILKKINLWLNSGDKEAPAAHE